MCGYAEGNFNQIFGFIKRQRPHELLHTISLWPARIKADETQRGEKRFEPNAVLWSQRHGKSIA
jgi:hypothetical protein